MKQCFRLMGMPDKVLAFDELPDHLLAGLDMTKADGFPRHWKEWLGKSKRTMRIPPERNPLTGEVRTYKPIEEEDYFFYLIDWNIRSQEDRWKEITAYVKANAPSDMRISEKLEDMAVPLAKDKMEAVSLEPEQTPVIPLNKSVVVSDTPKETKGPETSVKNNILKCEEKGCTSEFDKPRGLRMHNMKKHPKPISEPIPA